MVLVIRKRFAEVVAKKTERVKIREELLDQQQATEPKSWTWNNLNELSGM